MLFGGAAPAFAIVDINLGSGGSGLNVGRALASRGTAVLYASAYCAKHQQAMRETGARACLEKPYDPEEVPIAFEAVADLLRGEAPLRCTPNFHQLI